MNGLGGTGAQQSKDCSFAAGSVSGAPLRISWFLVIFFVYQLLDVAKDKHSPLWVSVVRVTGNEFLLLLTVLSHEMGHGTMARRCGGNIAQVLLWPFGGICFTSRASGRNPHQKLVDDLWIVGAGPATHFPMSAAWLVVMLATRAACGLTALKPVWHLLIPFASLDGLVPFHCDEHTAAMFPDRCVTTNAGYLFYMFIVQAIQLNVLLFLFNVFFPMYPMDGSKLIVCSLQLFCKASARFSAKFLVYTSVPLAVVLIVHTIMGMRTGGMMSGITAYMGVMCLAEAYQIHKLLKEERLYTHPLFEQARSELVSEHDSMGSARRLNDRLTDDPETTGQGVQFSEVRAFSGAGRSLGGGEVQPSQAAPAQAPASGRGQWLQKLEASTAERGKSVKQLEEERLEKDRLDRESLSLAE